MESVVDQIRSVLISIKGKSDLRELQRDYKMLVGEDIPYRKLGFQSLESFVRSIPSINVTQVGGNILLEAIATNKTKHMVSLINKQKPAKKKNGGSRRLPPRHYSRQPPRAPRHHKPQLQRPQTTANQQWRAAFVERARPKEHVHQLYVTVDNGYADSSGASSLQHRLERSVVLAPSPPHSSQASENSARKNPRLQRSASSPGSSNQRQDRPRLAESAYRSILNSLSQTNRRPTPPPQPMPSTSTAQNRAPVNNTDSRPRMRYMSNLTPSAPSAQLPGAAVSGPRFNAPTLSRLDMDTLMREAVAQYDPNGQVWKWSSSDDSSPQRSGNETTPPRNEPVQPNSPVPPVRRNSDSVYNNPNETEILKKLKEFAREHELGEVCVRILPRAKKNSRVAQYDCSIKVDNQSFSSYPRDCTSTAEAEAEAAQQALTELSSRYSKDRKNRKLLLATEHDVLTRIPPIIECHFHGVWASQLALDYEDQYSEQLPPNWLALLDTLPTIAVEPTLDNRYVLKVCKIGEKNKTADLSSQVSQFLSSEVSVPSNKIRLTEDGWMVEVTYAASTVEVWCRIIGSEEANRYFDVNQQMQLYYSTKGGQERAINVAAGGFYVVQFDNCWSRVRVLSTHEHDVACYFLDFGDEQVVSRADMYELKREFAREQSQAFVCRLSGLEELANMKAAQSILEQIAGKTYLAKPQLHEAAENPNGPEAISIILYDSENSDDGDVVVENEEDVNRLLIRQITADSVGQLDPLNINRVYVTHATDKGDLYVQPHCEAFSKINELITNVDHVDFDSELPGPHIPASGTPEATPEEDYRRLYLARWTHEGGDGHLYRTKVTDRSPCGQYAQLYFIDFGNTQIINISSPENVYPLEKISEVLSYFPPLATRVRLDVDLQINPKTGEIPGFAKKVLELMPSEQLVLLKISKTLVDEDGISVPVCEMFRRSETHNELFSVGASLRYGTGGEGDQMDDNSEDGNNNDMSTQLAKKLERLRSFSGFPDNRPVPSTGELATPDLPAPEALLDVRVPFAVNPWNFFVQPYSSASDLLKLMEQLQQRCSGDRRRLSLEDVVPGKIYAAKHIDGVWYRTSVIKIINSGSISVFYCDVGYYANLTVEQLVPLDPEFLTLPYQAIKARLSGIKPRDTKWSMDDCRHFENLVRNKNFVSIVVAFQQDELYKCDAVLVLRLIDTSTDKDVYLDQLLIAEGIAAEAPAK